MKLALSLFLVLFLVACSSTSPTDVKQSDAQKIKNIEYGIIKSSTPVKVKGEGGIIGATTGAMIGGLGGGFLLGLIGWGISYVVVAGGNPQPEYYEIQSLDVNCQNEFSNGYKQGALKVKKSNVNIGGAIGTLTIVMLMSSSY